MKTSKSNQYLTYSILFGLIVFVFNVQYSFSQIDIESIKDSLKKLNQQLIQIDAEQRNELNELQKRSNVKGEFETTKQFDERSKKESAEWMSLYNEIDNQQGTKREKIYKQINEIISKEFVGTFQAELGMYDADTQTFPIIINGNFEESIKVPLEDARNLKENFSEAEKNGVLGLVLDFKDQPTEYLISGRVKFNGKTYNIKTDTFSNARAMRMLFGNYDETSKYSVWTLSLQKFYVDGSDEDIYVPATVYAKILTVKSYTDQNREKRVIITETAPTLEDNSCHACAVFISVAVFSKQNGYWKIEQAQKNTGKYGSWGKISPPTVQKIGSNHFALKYEWSYGNMGNFEGGEIYVTLDGGIFNEILDVPTFSDNSGAASEIKDRVSSESKVIFKPNTNAEYFDATVTTSGKKGKKIGKRYFLSPFTKTEIYRVSNSKYQIVKE